LWSQANEPQEAYAFNTIGLGGESEDNFIDMFCGNDMLPYTDDDIALPAGGNAGGTWGFAHFDINSDNQITAAMPNEHIFTVIRRDDDDAWTYSAMNRPEYGTIREAEDWIDYHDARNLGPSETVPGSEGDDFEHQDRPFFEGQSNAYLYNNLRANQHGEGRARYYFENVNVGSTQAANQPWVYDEVEGHTKFLNFQNNLDDPDTALNERGTCRNSWMRSPNAVIRGYLIPVGDLAGLQNGSLPSLFGWEPAGFDLAAYLRDVIEPKLSDGDLSLFHPVLGSDPATNLPITHFALQQIEVAIEVNIGNSCADPAIAQSLADYWGIPATGATYRASHLLGFNNDVTPALFGESLRLWADVPADGALRNLWLHDHFFRDNQTIIGKYTFVGGPWTIVDDPGFAVIDNTNNNALQAEAGGIARAPLPRPLATEQNDEVELPMEVLVDIAVEEGSSHQIVLFSGGNVQAYAEIRADGTAIRLGGTVGMDGFVTGGMGVETGLDPIAGNPMTGEYTRYVLQVTLGTITLLEAPSGDYVVNDFTNLNSDNLAELVSAPIPGGNGIVNRIDEVGVALSDSGLVSTIAVFAAPPGAVAPPGGRQKPGDCNQDGNLDISDGICLLGFLFRGQPVLLPCGDGTSADPANLALLSMDGNPAIELTDPIRIFQFLFQGGAQPANCVDPQCDECVEIVGCPDVCK
jgi:hypothetical protein